MRKLIDILTLTIFIAFTTPMIICAIVSDGALIYFYEPNKQILYLEVAFGVFAISSAIVQIFDKLLIK